MLAYYKVTSHPSRKTQVPVIQTHGKASFLMEQAPREIQTYSGYLRVMDGLFLSPRQLPSVLRLLTMYTCHDAQVYYNKLNFYRDDVTLYG
jgi:hypothetical protein